MVRRAAVIVSGGGSISPFTTRHALWVGDHCGGAERPRGQDHVQDGNVVVVNDRHTIPASDALRRECSRHAAYALVPLGPGQSAVAECDRLLMWALHRRARETVAQKHCGVTT